MFKNKGYDKVTVFGVAACVLAFILLSVYNARTARQRQPLSLPPVVVSSESGEVALPAVSGTTVMPALPEGGAVAAGVSGYDPKAPVLPPDLPPVLLGKAEEFDLEMDPVFGGARLVRLLQYDREKKNGQSAGSGKVELGSYDYPFLSLHAGAAGIALEAGAEPEVSGDRMTLQRQSVDGTLLFTEEWQIAPDQSYELRYRLKIRNLAATVRQISGLRLDCGAMSTSLTPGRKTSAGEAAGGVSFGLAGSRGKTTLLNLKSLQKKMTVERQQQLAVQPAAWLAVHSKYFLLAVQPESSVAGQQAVFAGIEANACPGQRADGLIDASLPQRLHARAILAGVQLEAGQEIVLPVTAYAGPKDVRRLHAMGNGMDSIMEMDRFFFWSVAWMGWISRIMLSGMLWISRLFPPSIGYGLGIVGLTFLVKLLFWPLTHRSTASMRKMQLLQPELKKMREKYKDQPQKMYQKQQELFKANHVSQLGGCLPMLLQIPVFFALFNTFRNAIELRHAGFLWALDLSMPDDLFFTLFGLPIRPFALLMGGTMYWQQKLTPSPDPQQARMMEIMSVVFIFFFYGMPSALTLYMTVSQLLGIAQMLLTRKYEARKGNPAPQIVIP